MATLIRWSTFARPAGPGRKPLSLPASWPLVFATPQPQNAPVATTNPERARISKALATPFLERIVETLLTDPDVWNTGPTNDNLEWTARWMAERLVLWLYGMEVSVKSWSLRDAELSACHQEGRRLRNAFLDAVPYITERKDTCEPRNLLAPDGSVNLWTAVFAFNVFRFRMCDAMEAFELSQQLDNVHEEVMYAESTAMCESNLILASRLREHAALLVLLETGKMVREAPATHLPSFRGLVRRSLDVQRPSVPKMDEAPNKLIDVLSLTRVVLNNLLSFRLLLEKCDKLDQISTLVRSQGVWASSRTLSFTALCVTSNRDYFEAVRAFEAAAVEETHAFQRLLSSNDILEAGIEEELLSEDENTVFAPGTSPLFRALRKSWLRVCIMLKSERFDHQLFKGVDDRDRLRVESLFDTALPAAMTSSMASVAAFYHVFMSWCSAKGNDKANDAMCSFLRDPDAHEMFHALLSKSPTCHTLLTTTKHVIKELPCEFSLADMTRNMRKESERRMTLQPKKGALESCSFVFFEAMQFREPEMETLVRMARTRGWEA
jgi:hypothetical protein